MLIDEAWIEGLTRMTEFSGTLLGFDDYVSKYHLILCNK